jgi:hypothetical protein
MRGFLLHGWIRETQKGSGKVSGKDLEKVCEGIVVPVMAAAQITACTQAHLTTTSDLTEV